MENKKLVEYNIIISHNQVMVVDNIDKKEIEKGGKYSTGYDYNLGLKINILDKDYGKSAELMRSLLEDGDNSGMMGKILLIVGGLIVGLIAVVILFNVFQDENINTDKKLEKIMNIEKPKVNTINTLENKEAKKQVVTNPVIIAENTKPSVNIENDDTIRLNNSLELARLEFRYEKEKLLNEKLQCDSKNSKLQETINILNEKLLTCSKPIENIDRDSFLYFLGDNVYKRCKKLEKQGKQNACKDLYYKFIEKNDKGLNKLK